MPERRMKDEELEALLRNQPRRMPSARLWERLEAQATSVRPRRRARLAWVGVVAAAAGLLVACLMSRPAVGPTQVAPIQPPRVRRPASAREIAVAAPGEGKPFVHKRLTPRVVPVKNIAPPQEIAPRTGLPRTALAEAQPTRPADAIIPPGPNPEPTVAPERADESSYYLEVSHEGERSVLSGSVTRDDAQRVTQISIRYDPAERVDTKSVN